MQYFECSREFRQKILLEEDMLKMAKMAFDGEIAKFSFGGTADLYRIGRLPSGLYAALRVFSKEGGFDKTPLKMQKQFLEDYCRNAEELDLEGKEVPKFCVGIVYGQRAGIITEDLTAGGAEKFEHTPELAYGWIGEGANRKEVFVDIDFFFKQWPRDNPKYFLEGGIINITRLL